MRLSCTKKIGLVGYSCLSGLGELNNQIADHLPISEWLVFPHRMKTTKKPRNTTVLFRELRDSPEAQIEIQKFLERIDVLLFCETPYYSHIVEYAKALGKRIVCIPMQEWMPPLSTPWIRQVDRYICPIYYAYERFCADLPCVYYDWPVDINRFAYTPRTTCERFLFLNGNGGYQGRKGMDTISRVLRIWPEIPLTVFSQSLDISRNLRASGAKNLKIIGETLCNTHLYLHGDVLLCPHTVDGLALEPREAAACGIPFFVTDGPIWEDLTCCLGRIPSGKSTINTKTTVDCWVPSPQNLVSLCQGVLGTNILEKSKEGRQWAEERSWDARKEDLLDLIVSE